MQIEGRAADDLEHVSGRGLLLEGFAQFVEQAGVLDGDDGLSGEDFDQRYLLVREGADLMPVDHEGADEIALLDDRDVKGRANPPEIRVQAAGLLVCHVGRGVGHLNGLPCLFHPAEPGSRRCTVEARNDIRIAIGVAIDGGAAKARSIVERERADLGTAQTRGILDQRIEDRSKLPWRA